jgi:hypothetical protein
LQKRTKKILRGCRGVAREARDKLAKVFCFFSSEKKTFLPAADERRVQDFGVRVVPGYLELPVLIGVLGEQP